MISTTKNGKQIWIKKLDKSELENLCFYLENLSSETKKHFGPHPFNMDDIKHFYADDSHKGYIALLPGSTEIIAYSVVKTGYLEHDSQRLRSYGLTLDNETDSTFAPSVSDAWQNCGIGNIMFRYIILELKKLGKKRIILWGGVQADNYWAVHFYKKNGFKKLGDFEYYGWNTDMVYYI